MHRSHIRQHMEQNRMACFVISGNPFLFIRDHPAFFLCSDPHLYKRLLNICLHDKSPVTFCGIDGRLIHHIGQIRAYSAGSCQGNFFKIHAVIQQYILGVNL